MVIESFVKVLLLMTSADAAGATQGRATSLRDHHHWRRGHVTARTTRARVEGLLRERKILEVVEAFDVTQVSSHWMLRAIVVVVVVAVVKRIIEIVWNVFAAVVIMKVRFILSWLAMMMVMVKIVLLTLFLFLSAVMNFFLLWWWGLVKSPVITFSGIGP